jgi:arylsulfatase A-like enzyme
MTDTRPNLILILTDHWRGDSLGRLGHPVAETPHLDSISTGGVTFTNGSTVRRGSCARASRTVSTGTHGWRGPITYPKFIKRKPG